MGENPQNNIKTVEDVKQLISMLNNAITELKMERELAVSIDGKFADLGVNLAFSAGAAAACTSCSGCSSCQGCQGCDNTARVSTAVVIEA